MVPFLTFSGVKVMFRVALVLFKFTLGKPEHLIDCPTIYETLEKIRNLPPEIMREEFLAREVSNIFSFF